MKLNLGTEEHPVLVDNPLYNINNRPFNAVATISGGKIERADLLCSGFRPPTITSV